MPTATPLQAIPVPVGADNPDIPTHVMTFMTAMEQRGVMRFADTSARNAAVTSPVNGMFVWLTTPKILTYHDGLTWKTFGQSIQALQVLADDGTNEGGEITFIGAGSHKNWGQDLFQNTMRFKYDVAGTPVVVATLSLTRLTLGTNVRMNVGGVDQPVIHSGTAAPGAGLGSDGDLYFRYT